MGTDLLMTVSHWDGILTSEEEWTPWMIEVPAVNLSSSIVRHEDKSRTKNIE